MTPDAPLSEASFVIRYTAYELVNIPERSIYNVPAPGMEVVAYADYRALASRVKQLEDTRDDQATLLNKYCFELADAQARVAEHHRYESQLREQHAALRERVKPIEDALRLMLQAFDPTWPGACAQDCFDTSDGHGYEMQEVAKSAAKEALATGAEGSI